MGWGCSREDLLRAGMLEAGSADFPAPKVTVTGLVTNVVRPTLPLRRGTGAHEARFQTLGGLVMYYCSGPPFNWIWPHASDTRSLSLNISE